MKFKILTLIFVHAKYKPRLSVNLKFTKILANE